MARKKPRLIDNDLVLTRNLGCRQTIIGFFSRLNLSTELLKFWGSLKIVESKSKLTFAAAKFNSNKELFCKTLFFKRVKAAFQIRQQEANLWKGSLVNHQSW
jgi:hypothetical protein